MNRGLVIVSRAGRPVGGRSPVCYRLVGFEPQIDRLSVSYSIFWSVGLLGVNGNTASAREQASNANNAIVAATQKNKAKKDQEVLKRRKLLKPDSLYRLDIDMSAEGKRVSNGKTVSGPTRFPEGMATQSWSYWFRTAGSG